MADKWNPEDDSISGRTDEDVRGVAGGMEDEDEFVETDDDLDEEEDDEESTTFYVLRRANFLSTAWRSAGADVRRPSQRSPVCRKRAGAVRIV